MAHLYPINLSLAGKLCLIVGGGKVAERKAASLLEYGPVLRLVSPRAENSIQQQAGEGLLKWIPREFAEGDLDGVFMVFIATDDTRVNRKIAELCRVRGILVNAVDDPPNCDFFVPSVLRRDSLGGIGIYRGKESSNMQLVYVVKLETMITEEHGRFVDMLGKAKTRREKFSSWI